MTHRRNAEASRYIYLFCFRYHSFLLTVQFFSVANHKGVQSLYPSYIPHYHLAGSLFNRSTCPPQSFPMSSNYSSYSSSSTSYASTTANGSTLTSGTRSVQTSHTDASGTTVVNTATQNLGEPAVQESRRFDSQGRELVGESADGGSRIEGPRVEEVTDAEQNENDKRYLERMEDEYAKREGGA